MNTQNEIPTEIATLIAQKEAAMEVEQNQKKQAEEQASQDNKAKGKTAVDEYISTCLSNIPAWLHGYLDRADEHQTDYERIAKGWDRVENIYLHFGVPGLAPICFDPKQERWMAATARWNEYDDDSEPYVSLHECYWRSDFEYTLVLAKRAFVEHLANIEAKKQQETNRQVRNAERLQESKMREEKEAQRELLSVREQEKERSEERSLFNALKSDPIAIHLLKAFVLLRDERSQFEQRLYEADETMYSIENRWSSKAEELRRQADDAQRRADDEKSRIQSDLEDAEAKLKKAERGW